MSFKASIELGDSGLLRCRLINLIVSVSGLYIMIGFEYNFIDFEGE